MKKIYSLFLFLFLFAFNYAFSQPFLPYGSAAVINAPTNEFLLTPDEYRQTGAVWSQTPLNLTKCFKIQAQINLGTDDLSGADGIAFVLAKQHTGTGIFGGSLGYAGITPSFDVEFDTWQNFETGINDPADDHIGFMKNGNINHTANNYSILPNIETGIYLDVTFSWHPVTKKLTVDFLNNTYTYTEDIANTIFSGTSDVYFGFTAGTGDRKNLHRVKIVSVQNDCPATSCTFNNNGYFGGFELGKQSISPTTGGSDLDYGLPRNGSYEIVKSVSELGGGGYLNIKPHTGDYFFASHTSNKETDRVWYANANVTPGNTYSFCAAVTLLKNLGGGAQYILGVYANGVQIGTGRVTFDWTSICGTYTVPAGTTKVEFSLRDPKKGLFFVAIDDICLTDVTSRTAKSVSSGSVNEESSIQNTIQNASSKLSYMVMPNPTRTEFKIALSGKQDSPIKVRLMDMNGRLIKVYDKLQANEVLKFGDDLKAGIYFAEITQTNQKELVKLVKL